MLAGLSGIVGFFGRLSFLVDENAHAIHFFISALLQLLDRCKCPCSLKHPSEALSAYPSPLHITQHLLAVPVQVST